MSATSTDARRGPSLGTLIAAVGAVLLLVALFLDWYDPGFSAWTVFEVWDMVLAALGLAVLAGLALEAGVVRGPDRRVPLAPIATAVLIIVGVALINPPPAAIGRDPDVGAWLALGAGALIAWGAFLSQTRLRISFQVDRRDPERTGTTPGAPEPTQTTRVQP